MWQGNVASNRKNGEALRNIGSQKERIEEVVDAVQVQYNCVAIVDSTTLAAALTKVTIYGSSTRSNHTEGINDFSHLSEALQSDRSLDIALSSYTYGAISQRR